MAIQRATANFERLSVHALAAWKQIPAAIAGDAMNRQNLMHHRITPMTAGYQMVGQARTVSAIAGDNSAIHAALGFLEPGQILVIDGGGYTDGSHNGTPQPATNGGDSTITNLPITATLTAGVVNVELTPETGISGLTTYRYLRQSIL